MKTRYLRPRWHVPRLLQVRVGRMWRRASSIDGQRWSANFPDTPGQAHPGPAPGHPCKWKWIPSSIPGHLISCRSSLLLQSARRSLLLYRVACSPTESPASHPRSLNRFIANLTLFTLQAHVARYDKQNLDYAPREYQPPPLLPSAASELGRPTCRPVPQCATIPPFDYLGCKSDRRISVLT